MVASGPNTERRTECKNADVQIVFTIKPEHVKRAKCKDPGKCVIAQALGDHFGDKLAEFQVGSSCTKIKYDGVVYRYKTPSRLRDSLRLFDVTGYWELPAGQYSLLPYTGAKHRWHKKKKKVDAVGGTQDVFHSHTAVPTRRVKNIRQMAA